MNSSVPERQRDALKPTLTAHLFPKVDGLLVELLRSLSREDWEKQTVSPKWKVKDVAEHLLDTRLCAVFQLAATATSCRLRSSIHQLHWARTSTA